MMRLVSDIGQLPQVEVIEWLERLSLRLADTRDATRERVTAVADDLSHELSVLKAELAEAKERIAALIEENARLREALNDASV